MFCIYLMLICGSGCVVRGEADVASGKFLIKLTTLPTSSESSVEVFLSQDNVSSLLDSLKHFLRGIVRVIRRPLNFQINIPFKVTSCCLFKRTDIASHRGVESSEPN